MFRAHLHVLFDGRWAHSLHCHCRPGVKNGHEFGPSTGPYAWFRWAKPTMGAF